MGRIDRTFVRAINFVQNSPHCYVFLPRFFSTLTQSFQSRNDVYKLLTNTPPPGIDELYAGIKYLSGPERIHAVKDSQFDDYMDEIESRISSMNSAFLGNYSLRLSLLAPQNPKVVKVVEAICDALIGRPEAHPREIIQCGFAAASVELDKPQFFEFVKQQLTANIDLASADTLNLSLHMIFKSKRTDRVLTALVCEKLAELTDRFIAHDVVNTLRTLSRTALCKGFLLRRLSTLITDNLDQFDKTQLIHCLYRLSTLKFVTEKFYSNVYTVIERELTMLSDPLKLKLLITASLCNLREHKVKELLKGITPVHGWETSCMFDYCYSLIYFNGAGKDVSSKVKSCLKLIATRQPITSRRYALTFKEALDELAATNPGIYESLSPEWTKTLDKFVKTEKEKIELQPGFQEVKHVLDTASRHFNYTFKPLEAVDNFQVNFLEESKKIVIDVESPTLLSNFAIKHRYLSAKGYKPLCVRYWEWRRIKTEVCVSPFSLVS